MEDYDFKAYGAGCRCSPGELLKSFFSAHILRLHLCSPPPLAAAVFHDRKNKLQITHKQTMKHVHTFVLILHQIL